MTIIEHHQYSRPSNFCSQCLGTGTAHVVGLDDGNRCRCTKWCDAHQMYCEDEE